MVSTQFFSGIYLFSSLSFYPFAMYSNLPYVTFLLYLYLFCFYRPPLKVFCCKPKYRANIIHHFIFVFFLYFSKHSSCRKDQFTVLILKFVIEDSTNPGLLMSGDPHWFAVEVLPSQVFPSRIGRYREYPPLPGTKRVSILCSCKQIPCV